MTARSYGRLSQLRLTYPEQTGHLTYDADLARELLGRTSELPASRHALIVVLTEYRHAIADLVIASGTGTPARTL